MGKIDLGLGKFDSDEFCNEVFGKRNTMKEEEADDYDVDSASEDDSEEGEYDGLF